MEKYKKTKNENICEDFESLLIKEESSIRKYIALNNKLKLENESLKEKIRIFEENNNNFEKKIDKIKEEYENNIQRLKKDIDNLNIIRNEMEKNEKKYIKQLEIKENEIYKLLIKLNSLQKSELKNKEETKDIPILLNQKLKKNSSLNYMKKIKIIKSNLDFKGIKINNTMIKPHSTRNLNKNNYNLDFKPIFNIFPDKNNIYNSINIVNKKNVNFINNENSIFNEIFGNNKNNKNNKSKSINENVLSVSRKIRKKFKFSDYKKYNSCNDIKIEDEKFKIKKNKILLIPKNNNNNISKNTFSDIKQNGKNGLNFDNNKRENYNKNLEPDINVEKKDIKLINKFRISNINKEENNLNKENGKKIILTNKLFDNKIINKEQDNFDGKNNKYKGISINYNLSTN